jgi:adenylate kinase family enzyme
VDRVLVAGSTGSGKTTLAKALAARFGMPRFELDALRHGPGWVNRPEFEADVRRFSAGDRWVTEDQYHTVLGDLLWQRADTVVWLDWPRRVVMTRVVRRSVARAVTRTELWNGNRESWRGWLSADHPVWWAWSQFERKRHTVLEYARKHPDVHLVRVASALDLRLLLAGGEGS